MYRRSIDVKIVKKLVAWKNEISHQGRSDIRRACAIIYLNLTI